MLPWIGNKCADQIKLFSNDMSLGGRKSSFMTFPPALVTASQMYAVGPPWLFRKTNAHFGNFLTLSVTFEVTTTCQAWTLKGWLRSCLRSLCPPLTPLCLPGYLRNVSHGYSLTLCLQRAHQGYTGVPAGATP